MSDYHEPARSYRTLLPLAALLLVLFLVDVALGSAGAHLLGWMIATVLVLGAWALVVRAARVTHSLTLTADELRVGDEAVPRAEIVSARREVGDAPVLGWPLGMPARTGALTVRLSDGRDVVVPTRFPERLATALAVAGAAPPQIRPAAPEDLPAIPDIDDRAETVFRVAGYDLPRIPFDEAGLAAAKAVFVSGTPPVGYVQVDEVDGCAHIAELAVLPSAMRRGTGTRLLAHACEWARDAGYPCVTLVTYADVPWNAPFYARHGFVEAPPDTPELARRRQRQTDLGLDAVGRRIVMRREL